VQAQPGCRNSKAGRLVVNFMRVTTFITVVLVSATMTTAQRNTDVPQGPAVWPLLNPKPKPDIQPKPKATAPKESDKNSGPSSGENTGTTGSTGKSNEPGLIK
jgi:hypothetical protein